MKKYAQKCTARAIITFINMITCVKSINFIVRAINHLHISTNTKIGCYKEIYCCIYIKTVMLTMKLLFINLYQKNQNTKFDGHVRKSTKATKDFFECERKFTLKIVMLSSIYILLNMCKIFQSRHEVHPSKIPEHWAMDHPCRHSSTLAIPSHTQTNMVM